MSLNPFARLVGQQFQMSPNMQQGQQGVNPMSALSASQDATGADIDPSQLTGGQFPNIDQSQDQPQQSKLAGLSFPTPMLDKYAQTLNNPPNPKDYQPSMGRKILGSIAGMGAGASPVGISDGSPIGFKYDPRMAGLAHDQIVDEPYDRAMGKFSQLAKIQGEGAKVEEQNIANKRGIAVAEARNEISQDRIRILEENARTAAKKESDIKADHDRREVERERQFNDREERLKNEFKDKQGNFEDKLALQTKIGELNDARHAAERAEQSRYHSALIEHMNATAAQKDSIIQQGAQRLTDLEKKLELATHPPPKIQEKEEIKEPGFLGKLFGTSGATKKTITTTTVGDKGGNPVQIPAGAKPNGQWITLPSGKQVYQEP